MTSFHNSFVLNMQLFFVSKKKIKKDCHCTNKSENFNNYMNLMFKTEKQEMSHLNYHNALWDCFGFHIAQYVAKSGNVA